MVLDPDPLRTDSHYKEAFYHKCRVISDADLPLRCQER